MAAEHHHEHHFLLNRELDELYVSIALRSFAYALISIFIPIYLYELGYSIQTLLLFFAAYSFVRAAVKIPAVKFGARFGFRHMILLTVPLTIASFLMLYSLPIYNWPLWMIAIIYGLATSFYWVGYHFDFATSSSRQNRGKQVSLARMIQTLGSATSPFFGGLILVKFGFPTLFVVGSILLFLSAFPLFLSPDRHERIDVHFKKIWKEQASWEALSFVAWGIERGVLLFVWPVALFMHLGNFEEVGFVASISLGASVVTTALVGSFTDRKPRIFLRAGSIASSIAWSLRAVATTVAQFTFIDIFYGIARVFVDIPFDTISMDKANTTSKIRFIVFRGSIIHFTRAAFFVGLAFWGDLVIGLLTSSAGVLLHFFL